MYIVDRDGTHYKTYANIGDHSVVAQDEWYHSKVSWVFDNSSPETSCFIDDLVCFILMCLQVFVFLNTTRSEIFHRRERNFFSFLVFL